MGAICGLIDKRKSKEQISAIVRLMIDEMAFRGADFKGVFAENGIGVGACVHKTVGNIKQPVTNEDGKILAVCDGEIYNYQEIRKNLLSKGHRLPLESDTEIIPHLYEEFGENFAAGLNGIFAIALYDIKNSRLLLVLDHLGSRSVFYASHDNFFIFASTIKVLLETGMLNREILPEAVDLYFAGTCVPHPQTMIKNIFSVRPGYAVILENGKIREHEYWTLNNIGEDYKTSEKDFQDQIRELALDAVDIRKFGDEPFGSVLSGGVDSSLICSRLAETFPGKKLQTFSVGFNEEIYDDSPSQDIMLRKYNLEKNKVFLSENMAVDLLLNVVQHCDYPVNNASAMGTFLCMKQVKDRGLKRVFDGEAADELFCGGGGVVGENLVELFTRLPEWFRNVAFGLFAGSLQMGKTGKKASLKRFCHRVCMPDIERMLTWLPAFDVDTRTKLFLDKWNSFTGKQDELESGKFYMKNASFNDGLNLYQYGACKTYLPNDLLFKNERMAAAHGVVNRTPFIDYRLVELAFKIPAKYKLTGYTVRSAGKKLIYRKALQGLIPDEILWHKKTRGFSQPTAQWLRKGLKNFVMDTVLGRQCKERGIFNLDFLHKIVKEHMDGREDRDRLLWGVLTFELWMREFVD